MIRRAIYRGLLTIVLVILSGCEIQGGVARPTTELTTGATNSAASVTVPVRPTSEVATPLPRDGSLRIGLLTDPGDLLPYHTDSADERLSTPISQLIFPAPLLPIGYTYTTTGVLERVPSLENGDLRIETVQVYRDASGRITNDQSGELTEVQQLSVIFRWNPTLRWSDGEPLTAADSLFAYELALQIDMGQATASKLELIERYEQIDAHTTQATLKPDFIDAAYITSYFTPLPRHLLADRNPADLFTSDYALRPVGYGAYQVEQREQGKIRLTTNPYAPPDGGEFTSISFIFRDDIELLRSSIVGGSLDLIALDQPLPETIAALQSDAAAGALTISTAASPVWEHLDFNLDLPVLQDIRVRRAIAHAINREAMIATFLGGYGKLLESWIVPEQWAAAPPDQLTRYPYLPDEARRLLDEAGIVDSDGDGLRELSGQPLGLSLVTTQGSPLRLGVAQQIRADLEAIGIAITIEDLPTADLYHPEGPLFRRTFELALFAWIAGPDPRGWERWSCAAVPSENNRWTGNNFSGWCFFEADRAIRTATTVLDEEERRAAYLRQQQLFTQEIPILPLFQRVDLVLTSPTLRGVRADPTAPFTWNIATWRRT